MANQNEGCSCGHNHEEEMVDTAVAVVIMASTAMVSMDTKVAAVITVTADVITQKTRLVFLR